MKNNPPPTRFVIDSGRGRERDEKEKSPGGRNWRDPSAQGPGKLDGKEKTEEKGSEKKGGPQSGEGWLRELGEVLKKREKKGGNWKIPVEAEFELVNVSGREGERSVSKGGGWGGTTEVSSERERNESPET